MTNILDTAQSAENKLALLLLVKSMKNLKCQQVNFILTHSDVIEKDEDYENFDIQDYAHQWVE